MGAGSTSNSQFSGFSSQAPMTSEQQAFFESQQAAFVAFQQDSQNRQQNPPQFEMPQQQSQSSNSLSQTESQPKKGRLKRTAKKGKSSKPIDDVNLRWTSDEETLLVECFVAVSKDPSRAISTEGHVMISGFERIQSVKFSKTYKGYVVKQMEYVEPSLPKVQRNLQRCNRLKKSGENEVDLMKWARGIYQDENKNSSLITKKHGRFCENMQNGTHPIPHSTKDLSPDDAYWIELQKKQIKNKLRSQMPRDSNQTDDSDE
nr:hypothetical protein [Tanacetum cinerariifolium]